MCAQADLGITTRWTVNCCELLGFNRVSSEQITEKASVLIL
jgi:hypothetical protein